MTFFEIFQFFVLISCFALIHALSLKIDKLMQIESRLDSLYVKFERHENFHESANWKHYRSHCCKRCGCFLEDGQTCECLSFPEDEKAEP